MNTHCHIYKYQISGRSSIGQRKSRCEGFRRLRILRLGYLHCEPWSVGSYVVHPMQPTLNRLRRLPWVHNPFLLVKQFIFAKVFHIFLYLTAKNMSEYGWLISQIELIFSILIYNRKSIMLASHSFFFFFFFFSNKFFVQRLALLRYYISI